MALTVLDLSPARVVLPADASPRLQRAADLLIEEVGRRSHLTWRLEPGDAADESAASIVLGQEPPLVRGPGAPEDAAYLRSALRGCALPWEPGPVRTSWISPAESLAERPLELVYHGLDPEACYGLRVVYGIEKPHIRVRCAARGSEGALHEVHPLIEKTVPHRPLECAVPAAADGEVVVSFQPEPYLSGKGHGCQVWLLTERRPTRPRTGIFH